MEESEIRKYARLMEELSLTGLEIEEGDLFVRLERREGAPGRAGNASTAAAPVGSGIVPSPGEEGGCSGGVGIDRHASTGEPAGSPTTDSVVVKSPLVGLFYAAPAENADPYVSIGDTVKAGQTLCIVEAMKLMNEIPADCDGVVDEICVTDGQVVECGTELFRIRR